MNGGSIYHGRGIEGHWFMAIASWESFVKPIIASALAKHG